MALQSALPADVNRPSPQIGVGLSPACFSTGHKCLDFSKIETMLFSSSAVSLYSSMGIVICKAEFTVGVVIYATFSKSTVTV